VPPLLQYLEVNGQIIADISGHKEGEEVWISFLLPKGQAWTVDESFGKVTRSAVQKPLD
jgi:hypothetical protein